SRHTHSQPNTHMLIHSHSLTLSLPPTERHEAMPNSPFQHFTLYTDRHTHTHLTRPQPHTHTPSPLFGSQGSPTHTRTLLFPPVCRSCVGRFLGCSPRTHTQTQTHTQQRFIPSDREQV